MTDQPDTPPTSPAPLVTGGTIHPPAAIQTAAARIRRFLELWDSAEDVIGFTEEFRLDPADLTVVLDALDACTVPTGFISFPKPLSKQEYEEVKARWIEAQQHQRVEIHYEPPTDAALNGLVRRWIRTRPRGGGA